MEEGTTPRTFKWRAASVWLDRVCERVRGDEEGKTGGGAVRHAFERAVTRELLKDLDPEADPDIYSFGSDAILDLTPNQAISICKEALEAK